MKTINYLSRKERIKIYAHIYRRYLYGLLVLACVFFSISVIKSVHIYMNYRSSLIQLEQIRNDRNRQVQKKSVEDYQETLNELANNLSYKQYSSRMKFLYSLSDVIANIRHSSDAALGIESIVFQDDNVVIKGFAGDSKTVESISQILPKEEGKYHATQHAVEGTTGFSFVIKRDSESSTNKKKTSVQS